MNKDELKGKFDQAKGRAKQKGGELTDNPKLEAEGAVDRASGNVQEGFGTAKRKVEETVDDISDDDD